MGQKIIDKIVFGNEEPNAGYLWIKKDCSGSISINIFDDGKWLNIMDSSIDNIIGETEV